MKTVLISTLVAVVAHATVHIPLGLRTNGRVQMTPDILLIDSGSILSLSWSAPRNSTFFRVRVMADGLALVSIFDSGPVESQGQRLDLPLEQIALAPASRFRWEVVSGDAAGDVLSNDTWSSAASFETPPSDASWEDTEWVGGFNQLRGDFSLNLPNDETVLAARAYVTGVGSFYLTIGGQRVGDHVMDPAFTVFDRTILFVAFDVTDLLAVQGVNVVGAELGSGQFGYLDRWCNISELGLAGCRALRLQIVVAGSAGSVRRFVSSTHGPSGGSTPWVGRQGPIVYDHLWHGEIYDGRLSLEDWGSLPLSTWPDGTWQPAVSLPDIALGVLAPQVQPPIRQVQVIEAVSAEDLGNGTLRFDFGRNIAGFCTLSLGYDSAAVAAAGDAVVSVRMKHTEILGDDGAPFNNYFPGMEFDHSPTCNMPDWYSNKWFECANQTDMIVADLAVSPPVLSFTPSFTYHGFRFVDMTISPANAAANFGLDISLVAKVARSDLGRSLILTLPSVQGLPWGTPDLLNRVYRATLAASESQLWGIPTDCPQREKRGWMGDAHMSSDGLMQHYNSLDFHAQFLQSMRDDQLKGCSSVADTPLYQHCNGETDPMAIALMDGSIPDVVPYSTGPYGSFPGSPVWASGYVVIARNLLRRFGPDSLPVLEKQYDGLVSFMDYLGRTTDPDTGLLLTGGLGDWVPPGGNDRMTTPAPPTSAFYYLLDLMYMQDISRALGKVEKADAFAATLASGKAAFHSMYWSGEGQGYCFSLGQPGAFAQTCTALALHIGAPPTPETAADAAAALVSDIQNNGTHFNVGIVGMTFMFDVLQNFGYDNIGLEFLLKDDYPSLGHMVANDATTLWEAWEGDATTISSYGTSRNHIMFGGGVLSWVASALSGLDVGYDDLGLVVTAKPCAAAVVSLGSGAANHSSGALLSWSFAANLLLAVVVPSSATGVVEVPIVAGNPSEVVVTSSGGIVWQSGGFVGSADGFVSGELATYGNQTAIRLGVLSGSYPAITVNFGPTVLP